METNGIRKAATIESERTITSESGQAYRIRRLSPLFLTVALRGIQDIGSTLREAESAATEAEAEAAAASAISDPSASDRVERMMSEVIRAGLVLPHFGACPEGHAQPCEFAIAAEATIWSLGLQEAGFLYRQILAFGGVSREAAEEVGPFSSTTRRSPSTSGASDSGSDPPPF